MIAVPLAVIFVVWVAAPTSTTGKRMISMKRGMDDWKPVGYGNPMLNDPTLVYVPPVLDPVHYGIHTLEPMWPIRGSSRLQAGNHNGKHRPTLLMTPEGAGHFQNVAGAVERSHIKSPSLPSGSSLTSLWNSYKRNDQEESSFHVKPTHLPMKPMTICCTEEPDANNRRHNQATNNLVRNIERSDNKDIVERKQRVNRKIPRFQFVQQVRSRVRMYGTQSGGSK